LAAFWGNLQAATLAATLAVLAPAGPAMAQRGEAQRIPPAPKSFEGEAWRRMPVRPGGAPARMASSTAASRRAARQCIPINTLAGAQLLGDRTIEVTLKGGARWRMLLAEDCPALSFYQGFYYQPAQAGQLCAGRDAVGARSGGECGIAAIVPVPPERKSARKRRTHKR
jgi:hypothetical protein